jgi:hypothetical protein
MLLPTDMPGVVRPPTRPPGTASSRDQPQQDDRHRPHICHGPGGRSGTVLQFNGQPPPGPDGLRLGSSPDSAEYLAARPLSARTGVRNLSLPSPSHPSQCPNYLLDSDFVSGWHVHRLPSLLQAARPTLPAAGSQVRMATGACHRTCLHPNRGEPPARTGAAGRHWLPPPAAQDVLRQLSAVGTAAASPLGPTPVPASASYPFLLR